MPKIVGMDRKLIAVGVVGLLAGVALTALVGFYSLPGLMMQEDQSPHDFEQTTSLFEEEIDAADWSIVTTHDMQQTMEKHGYEDVEKIQICELCNPGHAAEILTKSEERIVSPMMPCRVAIYEKADGNTYIGRMNSGLVARPFGGTVSDVMQDAAAETEVVIDAVLEASPEEARERVSSELDSSRNRLASPTVPA